jgi:hypothetical protein
MSTTLPATATATAASSHTLHPSDFARLMGQRHYLFLSQSLNDLRDQVDRHQTERTFIYDRLLEAGLVEPRIEPSTPIADSIVTNGRAESITTNGRQMTRRYHYHPYTRPTPHSSFDRRRQSLNHTTHAELGTKENPIYVRGYDDDDDAVRCEGCGEDGHVIWDCTKEYEWRVPYNGYNGDPSHSPSQDFKQKAGSPQRSKISKRAAMQEDHEEGRPQPHGQYTKI